MRNGHLWIEKAVSGCISVSPVTVAVFLRFVWMLVLWVSRLVVRPDVEKSSKRPEIGHGPVASKTQHGFERPAITTVVSRFIWMLVSKSFWVMFFMCIVSFWIERAVSGSILVCDLGSP